ncbi:MAG: DUF2891 domain-containing protein [Chloroflexota bacterium]|nr:DUF2891 domain-containing protein [Chloroflexota bacterium]
MMTFDAARRRDMLTVEADRYLAVALANVTREFPSMSPFVAMGPGPVPAHRTSHPAFYGSFDWHSCVEMVWVVVRLLRRFPAAPSGAAARGVLDDLLTPENLAAEVAFFTGPEHRTIERPYGWGWCLTLAHELDTWDDPDGHRWGEALRPLAGHFAASLVGWIPRLTYPQRTGLHPNTAFGLTLALDHARWRAGRGDDGLLRAIEGGARRWFAGDRDYPAHYEPSGADFLSAALSEAELMSRILPVAEFPGWLGEFLPGLAAGEPGTLFRPVTATDTSDGQLAHLLGLNLSRAWAMTAVADRLPAGDPRIGPLLAGAERQAVSALPHVVGSDYMAEHWLAAYAVLLLS